MLTVRLGKFRRSAVDSQVEDHYYMIQFRRARPAREPTLKEHVTGPLDHPNSGLVVQVEEGTAEIAKLRADLTLMRQRVKELDERNIVNRDTLVAKLER